MTKTISKDNEKARAENLEPSRELEDSSKQQTEELSKETQVVDISREVGISVGKSRELGFWEAAE